MKRLERLSYYEVEAIVDSKVDEGGNTMYLVKWKNWPPETNTWEPMKHLSTVKSLVQEFLDARSKQQQEEVQSKIQEPPKKKRKSVAQSQEVHEIVNNSLPQIGEVKRKRGRPRQPKFVSLQEQGPYVVVDQDSHKGERIGSILQQNTHPVIETPSQPLVKLEQGQEHKGNKRKLIRKLHRSIPKKCLPYHQKDIEEKLECEKERKVQARDEQKKEKWQKQEMGIQQVLLQCRSYTEVKVSFKDRIFYYQIPFTCDGKQQSLTVTSLEIMKVNPRWFQGFFEGFYL